MRATRSRSSTPNWAKCLCGAASCRVETASQTQTLEDGDMKVVVESLTVDFRFPFPGCKMLKAGKTEQNTDMSTHFWPRGVSVVCPASRCPWWTHDTDLLPVCPPSSSSAFFLCLCILGVFQDQASEDRRCKGPEAVFVCDTGLNNMDLTGLPPAALSLSCRWQHKATNPP